MPKSAVIPILPISLPPLGINREQAANLIGVSPSTFDKLVAARKMPRPRIVSAGRLVYDVAEISDAFRQLPHQDEDNRDVDENSESGNPWDDA